MNYYDDGGGITVRSLEFWHENKHRIGEVLSLEASLEPLRTADGELRTTMTDLTGFEEWNVEIKGENGSIFLSGCNCGYGGEGPNGTAKILAELGLPIEKARKAMVQKIIHYDALTCEVK